MRAPPGGRVHPRRDAAGARRSDRSRPGRSRPRLHAGQPIRAGPGGVVPPGGLPALGSPRTRPHDRPVALNTGLPRSPSGTALGLTAVAAALALAALPTFMVGGLAVQIRADIGLSETQLGAAVTLGFLVSALIGPAGGRLSDRLGARRSVLTGCLVSSLAMAGIGLSAEGFWSLAFPLMVAGAALALIDPGLAILITSVAPPGRQGLAFGIKEASIPAAALAAGIAVPAVALSLGWGWAFLVGLVPLVAVLAIVPQIRIDRNRPGNAVEPVSAPPRHGLLVVAGATAAASTAASGVSVFLTESAVAMGNSPETAGVLLAVGSIA